MGMLEKAAVAHERRIGGGRGDEEAGVAVHDGQAIAVADDRNAARPVWAHHECNSSRPIGGVGKR